MIVIEEIFNKIILTISKVLIGLLIAWILFKIINLICKRIENKLLKNSKIDVTVSRFITPLISKVLKFFVLICYIGFIGVETSSIAAAITSAGLAIGLAMQGSLSNFAGGFIILIMRPFKVGDYIQVCNESGSVESIQIFYTTLLTPDNKIIKIPNGEVASSVIVDYTSKNIRRVDLIMPISYDNDLKLIKEIILNCVNKTRLSLKEKEIFVGVNKYNGTYIDLEIRVWCKNKDYWNLYYMLLEGISVSFKEKGIKTPFFQYDINLMNKSV